MVTEAQELSEAVTYWLHNKSLTGLGGLLNEASMAVPIAEYLAARYRKEVESEKAHPSFPDGGRGRPKQIDFVRVKHGDATWHAAYECKFQKPDFYAIAGDICRLVCLAQNRDIVGTPDRYFVFAAKLNGKGQLLEKGINTGFGQRKSYFDGVLPMGQDNVNGKQTFEIKKLQKKQLAPFVKFAEENNILLPSKIVTKLSGWTQSSKYGCAVWKISSARGSTLLTRKELACE